MQNKRGPNRQNKGKARANSARQRGPNSTRGNTQLAWDDVEKDELIAQVNGSVALTATQYAINPALAATFPLGSVQASKFTEWKAEYCEFYFASTVSGYATQGTTGRVILACDYSALNGAPTTLQQAEALHMEFGKPIGKGTSDQVRLKLDARILNRSDPKYLRTAAVGGHSDIRLFDGGNLWFVTSGCQNADQIGELRVRYKFKVRLPNLSVAASSSSGGVTMYNQGAATALTGNTTNMAFDEEVVNAIGAVNTAGSIVLPAGNYKIELDWGYGTSGGDVSMYLDGTITSAPKVVSGCAANVMCGITTYYVADGAEAISFRCSQSTTPPADESRLFITAL